MRPEPLGLDRMLIRVKYEAKHDEGRSNALYQFHAL